MRKRFFLNFLLILTLVVVMSTSAFAISESDVESAVSASGKEAVSGNVLVWFLCAIAFLKVSQKIDSFLGLGEHLVRAVEDAVKQCLHCGFIPFRFILWRQWQP